MTIYNKLYDLINLFTILKTILKKIILKNKGLYADDLVLKSMLHLLDLKFILLNSINPQVDILHKLYHFLQ